MKTLVLIVILAISASLGFGASQFVDSAGTVSIGTEGDFCIPGDDFACGAIGDNCYCADSIATCLCGEPCTNCGGRGNFTLTNISKKTINLTELIVEIDSEPTIKGIQPFTTPLDVSLFSGETFETPIPFDDSEGNLLDYSKQFGIIVTAEIIEDEPRGDGEPKVKKVKVKKKLGTKAK